MSSPDQMMHRFRVNPRHSYAERMITTRAELRAFVREKLCAQDFSRDLLYWCSMLMFYPTGEITGEPSAQMRWSRASYMRDIVARYHVRIEGWPLADVPFKNLSDVPNLGKLELLFSRWKDGSTYFRVISDTEYTEMVQDPSPWIGTEGGGEADETS